MEKIQKTEAEWREQLSDEAFDVCRRKATERAFTGKYDQCKESGTYHCLCCGNPLFSSDAKYDSRSGWPSYFEAIASGAVAEHEDNSLFARRVEVVCAKCDAHLGHVFPDGPQPTGKRYCMNSAALNLKSDAE